MRTLRDLEVTNGGLYDKIIDAQKKGGPVMTKGDIFSLVITGLLALRDPCRCGFADMRKGRTAARGLQHHDARGTRGPFDERALCRFWGKILLPMGAFLPMAAVGGIYDKVWPALAYLALVLGLVAFAIIYSNTGSGSGNKENLRRCRRFSLFLRFLFSWLGFRGFLTRDGAVVVDLV